MSKYKNFVGVDSTYVPAASMNRDTIFVPRPNGVSSFAPCTGSDNWAKGFASFVGDKVAPNEDFAPLFKLNDVYVPIQPSPPADLNPYDSHFSFEGKNVVGADIQLAQIGLAPAITQAPIVMAVPTQGAFSPAYGNPMDWSQLSTIAPPTATMPITSVIASTAVNSAAATAPTPDAIPNNLNAAAKPTHLLPIIIGLGIIGFFYFKNK